MALSGSYKQPRGTRAALDAKAAAGTILPGQIYVITDEDRLAVGLTANTYQAFRKQSEIAGAPWSLLFAMSDEATALTAGAGKIAFRIVAPPSGVLLTAVRASLVVAQSSGSILTVDLHKDGTTILGDKLTIDNGETTSKTAATPATIADATTADDALISGDIDQIGDGTAKGLKVCLVGVHL